MKSFITRLFIKWIILKLSQLKATYRVMPLVFTSPFILANEIATNNTNHLDIIKKDVSQVTSNLGKKLSFQSTHLNEQREFYVRLPNDYHKTKRDYPVIYLLDANNETLSYMDNLYFHSVTQIERLMQYGQIPESIIIGVPFKKQQWFSNTINNPKPFREYLTNELSKYINDNYRTLNNSILVGQSYSALFVINSLPIFGDHFNNYVAIEPILGNGALDKAIVNYQKINVKELNLQIIMGGETMFQELEEFQQNIVNSLKGRVNVSLEVFPRETHHSVYYPALYVALRNHFIDFRRPSKAYILKSNINHKGLLKYFDQRAAKYQVEHNEMQFQFAIYDVVINQLMAKNFDLAFDLWPYWKSKFKWYNVNRVINHFLRKSELTSAISLVKSLVKAEPTSIKANDLLFNLYQKNNQISESEQSRLIVADLLSDIFKKPVSSQQEAELNIYGYKLLKEERNQEAIAVFRKIIIVNPNSLNAYDSLADAYETNKNYTKAINTLKKSMTIIQKKEGSEIDNILQKIKRLEYILSIK